MEEGNSKIKYMNRNLRAKGTEKTSRQAVEQCVYGLRKRTAQLGRVLTNNNGIQSYGKY